MKSMLSWRFIIDKSYSGAKGIETAMLLRRLKDRVVNSEPGALQCIGLAQHWVKLKSFQQLVVFGKTFGEKFDGLLKILNGKI